MELKDRVLPVHRYEKYTFPLQLLQLCFLQNKKKEPEFFASLYIFVSIFHSGLSWEHYFSIIDLKEKNSFTHNIFSPLFTACDKTVDFSWVFIPIQCDQTLQMLTGSCMKCKEKAWTSWSRGATRLPAVSSLSVCRLPGGIFWSKAWWAPLSLLAALNSLTLSWIAQRGSAPDVPACQSNQSTTARYWNQCQQPRVRLTTVFNLFPSLKLNLKLQVFCFIGFHLLATDVVSSLESLDPVDPISTTAQNSNDISLKTTELLAEH